MNKITEEMMIEWIDLAVDLLERAKKKINESILLVNDDRESWGAAYDLYCDINVFLNEVWQVKQ